jgi:hypothetical protein
LSKKASDPTLKVTVLLAAAEHRKDGDRPENLRHSKAQPFRLQVGV